MSSSLAVWWDGAVAGVLRVDRHGEIRFAYAADWLADQSRPPISMSLPKRAEPFKRRECRPFFAGLLPEDAQRVALFLRRRGLTDRFSRVSIRNTRACRIPSTATSRRSLTR